MSEMLNKLLARLARRLGIEVLPDEIDRVRVFEDEEKVQLRVDITQKRPVDEIKLRMVIEPKEK